MRIVLSAAIASGLVALNIPAIGAATPLDPFANGAEACVQQALAERRLYKGALDGLIGPASVAAAASFATASGFPMSPLNDATTVEWCAVLAGWNAREANSLPSALP